MADEAGEADNRADDDQDAGDASEPSGSAGATRREQGHSAQNAGDTARDQAGSREGR